MYHEWLKPVEGKRRIEAAEGRGKCRNHHSYANIPDQRVAAGKIWRRKDKPRNFSSTGKTPQYDMGFAAERIVIPKVSLYSRFVCKIHQKSKL